MARILLDPPFGPSARTLRPGDDVRFYWVLPEVRESCSELQLGNSLPIGFHGGMHIMQIPL